MFCPWIESSGSMTLTELQNAVENFAQEHPDAYLLLMAPDREVACRKAAESVKLADTWDALVELRAFDAVAELWAHRSCAGEPFAWRIASEQALQNNTKGIEDAFLAEPKNYAMPAAHRLDSGRAEGDTVYATGGGRYTLPGADKLQYLRVTDYIAYREDNGQAIVADFRMAGFATDTEVSDYGEEKE